MRETPSASGDGPIRQLLDERVRAIRARDADAVVAQYDPGVVIYNLAPPLQVRGVDHEGLRRWFDGYDGPIGCEIAHERIVADGDVAFCNYLYRISGTQTSGREVSMWVRATLGLRRVDGAWKIVHEHDSEPIDMQTMKALFDLEP
jgi:ketosteroid isomerase-like protein